MYKYICNSVSLLGPTPTQTRRSVSLPRSACAMVRGTSAGFCPFPEPAANCGLRCLDGPRRFDWAGTRVRTRFQAAGMLDRAPHKKSLDRCLVQNSSATRRKPKSESAGFKGQSLVKERGTSIFFVRGVSSPLTNGGLISVMLLLWYW